MEAGLVCAVGDVMECSCCLREPGGEMEGLQTQSSRASQLVWLGREAALGWSGAI